MSETTKPEIKAGDKITFADTETTSGHGIWGGRGYVESIIGDAYFCIYTNWLFGPSGPYKLTRDDIELRA